MSRASGFHIGAGLINGRSSDTWGEGTGKRNNVVVALAASAAKAQSEAAAAEQDKFSAEAKIQQVEREKAALQDRLYAAKTLIDQVMSEGGKLLDSYHLDYSDIDFSGEGEEERCELGEGAHVIRTPPSVHLSTSEN